MYYENKAMIKDRPLLELRMDKYHHKDQALIAWT